MKKFFIPATVLLLMAGTAKAVETNNTTAKIENSQPMNAAAAKIAFSYEMLLEENLKLRSEAEALNVKIDELNNLLGYTSMMHTTIVNLNKEVAAENAENVKAQLDYARMMQVTLANLAVLASKAI